MLKNTLPDLEQKINNTQKDIVLVLVVSEGCEIHKSSLQQQLEEKVIETQQEYVELLTLCIDEQQMPFPKIETPVLYFFAPENQQVLFYRQNTHILVDLENDIQTAIKMKSGISYLDAKFDEKTKEKIIKTEQYVKAEMISDYPSSFQMARNLAKELWRTGKNAAKGLPILVDANTGFQRFSECQTCEFFVQETSRCQQCGCFMKTKTQLASASCPIGKWNAVV